MEKFEEEFKVAFQVVKPYANDIDILNMETWNPGMWKSWISHDSSRISKRVPKDRQEGFRKALEDIRKYIFSGGDARRQEFFKNKNAQ